MKRFGLLLLVAAASPALAADWEEKFYNPKPSEGDKVLPLPCGGAMVFRPVDVAVAGGVLDDRPTTLGDPGALESSRGYSDYQRTAYLSAPFEGDNNSRRYWVGKYDVTADQFATIQVGGGCPTASIGGRVPQTKVSWIQAETFAADWSAWLMKNARDKLPKRGNSLAFVRLPTEDEWEYAARGGIKVSPEEFLGATFPVPEGIQAYVWAGPSANNRVGQVGARKPNPLDLYDMLGNVDQMVLDPYRYNRVGRSHGMAGGIVVRGGDYSKAPGDLSIATRNEIPPYDPATNAPTVLAKMGFRLVLSATAQSGTPGEIQRVAGEFQNLGRAPGPGGTDDPRKIIEDLKRNTSDAQFQRGLDKLDATLASGARAQGDVARNAVLAQLEAATAMARMSEDRAKIADLMEVLSDNEENRAEQIRTRIARDPRLSGTLNPRDFADLDSIPGWRAYGAMQKKEAIAALDGYLRLLRQMVTGPANADIPVQGDVLAQELRGRNQQRLLAFVPVVLIHARQLSAGRVPTREQIQQDIHAAAGR